MFCLLLAFNCLVLEHGKASGQEATETRLALIVGNNAYTGKLELQSCINDAKAMYDWLRSVGYQPHELDLQTNLTREKMLSALRSLADLAKERRPKQVVIFYSGHGSSILDNDGDEARRHDGDTRDEAFLMVPGFDRSPESMMIRDDEFYEFTKEIASHTDQLIVILDSCHSGGGYKQLTEVGKLELPPGSKAKYVPESVLREFLLDSGVAEKKLGSLLTKEDEDKIERPNLGGKSLDSSAPADLEIAVDTQYVFFAACDQGELAISGDADSKSVFTEQLLSILGPRREAILADAKQERLTLKLIQSELREKLFRYKQSPIAFSINADEKLAIFGNVFPSNQQDLAAAPVVDSSRPTNLIKDARILEKLREAFAAKRRESNETFLYDIPKQKLPAGTVSLAFSRDGRYLVVGEENSKTVERAIGSDSVEAKKHAMARLWDLQTGEEIRRFGGHTGMYIQSVSISGDNALLATTCFTHYGARAFVARIPSDEDVRVWNAKTGEELLHLPNAGVQATLSTDGKWLVVVGTGHVSGYKLEKALQEKSPEPDWKYECDASISIQAKISPDDKLVAFAMDTDPRPLGRGIKSAVLDLATGKSVLTVKADPSHLEWSADSGMLVLAEPRRVIVIDVVRKASVRTFDTKYRCETVAFDLTGKEVMVVSDDGHYQRWELKTGKRIAAHDFDLYAKFAFSPDRRFLAMANREGTIDFVELSSGIPLTRIYQFHTDRTWLVEAIDGSITAPQAFLGPESLLLEEAGLIERPERIREIFAAMRPQDFAASSRPTGTSRLFVLAVGVSKYKYAEYNLNCAHADAEGLEKFFREKSSSAFDDVFTQVYPNEQATRDNVQKGLDWLVNSCTPEDAVVVLFSGHGIRGENGLYFVTHEGDKQGIQHTCVNWSDVAKAIAETKAGSILFLADCCHAGAFGVEHRVVQESVAKDFENKPGLFFYCSSTGEQVSQESTRLGHGLFTFSVLEALSGKADADSNSEVSLGELRTYVDKRVSELSEGKQTPSVPFPKNIREETVISKPNSKKDF